MKKFISALVISTILFWSVQYTFADTYSGLNTSQKSLFNRATSRLDPIVQKKGKSYRAKLVKALAKLANQTAGNSNIQQVLSALAEHYSDPVQPSENQTTVNTSNNRSLDCGWPFGDGYVIKQNPYIKSCEDINDNDKLFKYLLFANDRNATENYFWFSKEQRGETVSKFQIYSELTNRFLGDSPKMTLTEYKKLLGILGIDKSFFQSIHSSDYDNIVGNHPILNLVNTYGKNDKGITNFLLSQNIAMDNDVKTELWRIIRDYKGNKSGFFQLSDNYVATLEWSSNQWNTYVAMDNGNAVSSSNSSVGNGQYEPSQTSANSEEKIWNDFTQSVSGSFSSFKSFIENQSNINAFKSAFPDRDYKAYLLDLSFSLPESQDNTAIIGYLLSKWADFRLENVMNSRLSLGRLDVIYKNTNVSLASTEATFWHSFDNATIRNYLLSKLGQSPKLEWNYYAVLWDEYTYGVYSGTSNIEASEYVKYLSKNDEWSILAALACIGGYSYNLPTDANYELDFKIRAISKLDQLADALIASQEAKNLNSTAAQSKKFTSSLQDYVKTLAKNTVYRTGYTSENAENVNLLITKTNALKKKLIAYFLSKGFNPDDKNGWASLPISGPKIGIWMVDQSFREIATKDGNTGMLNLLK